MEPPELTSNATLSSPLPSFIDSPHSCPSRFAGQPASASLPTSPLMLHKSLTPQTVLPAFTEIICAPSDLKPCTMISTSGSHHHHHHPAQHQSHMTSQIAPQPIYLPGQVVKHGPSAPSSQIDAVSFNGGDKSLIHHHHHHHQHQSAVQSIVPMVPNVVNNSESFTQYRSNATGSPCNTPHTGRRTARSLSSRRTPSHQVSAQSSPGIKAEIPCAPAMNHIILTDQDGKPISMYPVCAKREEGDLDMENALEQQPQHCHMHPVENNNCSGGLNQNYEDELSSGLSSCHMSSIIEGRYDHSSLGTNQRNNSLSSNNGEKFVQYCSGTNGSR